MAVIEDPSANISGVQGQHRPALIAGMQPASLPAPPVTFSDLPLPLQSSILAHAAAPLNTCQASAALVNDQHLLETWLLQAAAAGTLKQPMAVAAQHKQWQVCFKLLDSQEFAGFEHQHSIALYAALADGQLGLVSQLLEMGALAEKQQASTMEDGPLCRHIPGGLLHSPETCCGARRI
jgi:hypothetical protein